MRQDRLDLATSRFVLVIPHEEACVGESVSNVPVIPLDERTRQPQRLGPPLGALCALTSLIQQTRRSRLDGSQALKKLVGLRLLTKALELAAELLQRVGQFGSFSTTSRQYR